MPASTIEASLEVLRDVKRHLKGVSETRSTAENEGDVAIK
jgi:hypothetical protein